MAVSTGAAILGGAALGGLLGGSGGGTKAGTVPFTNTTTPWASLSPYLTRGFGQARSIYGEQNQPGSLFQQAQGVTGQTLAGDYLNPSSNPYLKSSVEDALGLAKSAFAGQYGGAAGANLDNSGYQEALGRALGATATNAYGNAYQQERQNQMSAIPFAASLPYANLQGYMGALSPGLAFNVQQGEQPYFTNPTASGIGGALSGGLLAKMIMGGK